MGRKREKTARIPLKLLPTILVSGLALYIFAGSAHSRTESRAFKVPLVIEGEGVEAGQLRRPSGIAVDQLKRIYIADTLNHRIQVFDHNGTSLMLVKEGGQRTGSLYLPEDVAISSNGTIYVADTGNNAINFYTPDGKYRGQIPNGKDPNIRLDSPIGITFDKEGNLFIADTGNNRILKFDPRGNLLQTFGGMGSSKGRFIRPSRIAIDPEGNLWVADTANHRVQVLDGEGRYLRHFGKAGDRPGELKSPIGIVLDREGNAYVADSGNARVQKFDRKGEVLALVGHRGKNTDEFIYPNGLAMDSEGSLYIADSVTNRIQKLTFDPALALLEQGWISYEKKNYEVALSLWKRSLELDPNMADAMYAIGTFYFETGRTSTAIEWFRKTLTSNPSHKEAKKSLNKAYLKRYFPFLAAAMTILALLIIYVIHRQRKITALKASAKQLREEGRIKETIALYERLLELDRNNIETCKTLSELYDSEAMEEQSRKINRIIARVDPENIGALSHIGKNQLQEGKFMRAIETWKKAVRIDPFHSDAYFLLAVCEAQGISPESAVSYFLKAFELEQDKPETLLRAARSCIERGEFARGAIKLRAALSLMPDNKKAEKMVERMGEHYYQKLEQMAREETTSSLRAALKAWIKELEGYPGFEAAKAAFQLAREKAGETLFLEAKQELEGDQHEAALPKLEQALDLQPQNQDAITLLKEVKIAITFEKGYACYKEEDYHNAISHFQQTLAFDPDHSEAQKYLRYAQHCLEGGFRARFKYLDL